MLLVLPIRWDLYQDQLASNSDLDIARRDGTLVIFASNHSDTVMVTDNCIFYGAFRPGSILILEDIIADLDHSILDFREVIVKNYIEPGNVLVASRHVYDHVRFVGQLGDTHHVPNAFTFAALFLQSCPHQVLYSLSNPMHSTLFGIYVANIVALPPYPIEHIRFSSKMAYGSFSRLPIGCCLTLSKTQYNRTSRLKQLVKSPHIEDIEFYSYTSKRREYLNLLSRLSASWIPSLSGQLSPQILFALSQGAVPIVDCDLDASHYYTIFPVLRSVCITMDEFLLHSPLDSLRVLKSKASAIQIWQRSALSFRSSVGSEFKLLSLLTNPVTRTLVSTILPSPMRVHSTDILKAVEATFQYAKRYKKILIYSEIPGDSPLGLYQDSFFQCCVQIPHLAFIRCRLRSVPLGYTSCCEHQLLPGLFLWGCA